VRAEWPRLLRAALIILAAYCRAGRPQARIKPWASFEGWSALIRHALAWLDLPDPADTRVALADNCDQDVATLRVLIAVWEAIVVPGESATTATVLNAIKSAPTDRQAQHDALVSALPDKSGGLPSPNRLGYALRKYRGRLCDGQCFEAATDSHTKTAAWRLIGTEGK
jgi:hypothetical protein